MKLIADIGATKASWRAVGPDGGVRSLETAGVNVAISGASALRGALQEALSSLGFAEELHLYIAGAVNPASCEECRQVASSVFQGASIEVQSDLLGSARACCGQAPGIACILGTGANVSYFDGEKLVPSVRSGGFILGDEGSGAYLGKRLVSDYLKGLMPSDLAATLEKSHDMDYGTVVAAVYRGEAPGRYLASFCDFIGEHRDHPWMSAFLSDCFEQFVARNLYMYKGKGLPVNFVGSIAFFYRDFLEKALSSFGLRLGTVIRNPIDKLVFFASHS